jgi:hypothetical protein
MGEAMMAKVKYLMAFLVFMSTASGCASLMSSNPDKALQPAAMLRFSDIPVPGGFNMIAQQSYSFENGGVRVALLKYKGKGTLDQVLNFYKEQMPLSRWNLLNISEFGQRLLNFERENETCIITMQSQFGGAVLVTLSLGPKSSNTRNKRLPEEALK